jgi:hypothetical protein
MRLGVWVHLAMTNQKISVEKAAEKTTTTTAHFVSQTINTIQQILTNPSVANRSLSGDTYHWKGTLGRAGEFLRNILHLTW